MRWSFKDEFLLSIGGADTALMVWKHEGASGAGDSDDSDTDEDDVGELRDARNSVIGKFTRHY